MTCYVEICSDNFDIYVVLTELYSKVNTCLMYVYVATSLIYTRVYLQRNAADHCHSFVPFFVVDEISLKGTEFYFCKKQM